MKVLLISTYDLGHQPFGLASPAAWLAREGHTVTCTDLAAGETVSEAAVRESGLIAFHLPMHTATRLALPMIQRVRQLNPVVRLACYGLYAPLNRDLLLDMGVDTVVGGEFEPSLVAVANGEQGRETNLDRLVFLTPDRNALPPLASYSHLRDAGEAKAAGYTEATRGCKHLCRHCPVVPVYHGQFRVVQTDVVLADIRQQVAAGARHITFGDPDFFNGPTHSVRIVEALHAEFPEVTYDATIKIEHLKKHRDLLPVLKSTGCLFVTSAVESVDDRVLGLLDKNHTRRNFYEVATLMQTVGLALQPTFIAFMPWTTRAGYAELLRDIAELRLIENTAPVQLALRLLVTQSSRLLDLDDIQAVIGPFDKDALAYPWRHPDPEVDRLAAYVFALVAKRQDEKRSRGDIFAELWEVANGEPMPQRLRMSETELASPHPSPHMDEPWYCCAEPVPQV